MTLYELTGAMLDIYERMSEQPPEDPQERETWEQALNDTLAMLADDFCDKADGYGKVLKQLKADADAVKAEKMRLARRQQTLENGIERMREAMKCAMLLTDQKRIKTELFTFGIQTREKAFLDLPVAEIGADFWKVREPEADMAKIEKYLKEGHEVDFAHLAPTHTLTIR